MDVSVFPISMPKHIGFCIIAALFFILQYVRLKYWYELVLAAAVPLSLLVYVSESPVWFYGVGVLEFVLLVTAIVLYRVQAKRFALAEASQEGSQSASDQSASDPSNAEQTNPDPSAPDPSASDPSASDQSASDPSDAETQA